MRYLVLIYKNEAEHAQFSQSELDAEVEAYNAFAAEIQQRGVLLDGGALQPTSAATTVRVRQGKTVITDGPFAETREQLGGFGLLNCRDLDEAIELAAKLPDAPRGSIEIRPIKELS